ncbi:hypothetical protein K438DRAFT_419245 [Mycena galopus ATCC 62051]|nr:hypothetical protein K438DRAFT_419245 [Mycena galopus ATCC 62051]
MMNAGLRIACLSVCWMGFQSRPFCLLHAPSWVYLVRAAQTTLLMNSCVKLLPRLRGRRLLPSAKTPVKQLQNTILDEILDISKEARDAIAAEDLQAFEIAFPPQSPTPSHSGSSCSPTKKRQEALQTPTSSQASPPPSLLPLSATAPPIGEPVLRDVPASGLGMRRNFRGRPIHTIPIPPMPTTPPPTPPQERHRRPAAFADSRGSPISIPHRLSPDVAPSLSLKTARRPRRAGAPRCWCAAPWPGEPRRTGREGDRTARVPARA